MQWLESWFYQQSRTQIWWRAALPPWVTVADEKRWKYASRLETTNVGIERDQILFGCGSCVVSSFGSVWGKWSRVDLDWESAPAASGERRAASGGAWSRSRAPGWILVLHPSGGWCPSSRCGRLAQGHGWVTAVWILQTGSVVGVTGFKLPAPWTSGSLTSSRRRSSPRGAPHQQSSSTWGSAGSHH